MPQSTLIMSHGGPELEQAIRAKAYAFYQKLTTDDALPGLHIEPIKGAVDPRVRTGRVDDQYRAVMFRLDDDGRRAYVIHGIWNHDEANRIAESVALRRNPLNGIPEVRRVDHTPEPPLAPSRAAQEKRTYLGHTAAELVTGLGLDEATALRLADCADEDALLAAAADLGGWQGNAVIELATGTPMAEVRETFGLSTPEPVADHPGGPAVSDRELVTLIRENPAARAIFSYVEGEDDLRRVIEAKDFDAWRVWLHPLQRRLVDAHYNGSYRLAGGAGTGKTVVLVHRAVRLARDNPEARILATTFTTNLAQELRRQVATLDMRVVAERFGDPGVLVQGIDSLVSTILARADGIDEDTEQLFGYRTTDVSRRTNAEEAWQAAILTGGRDLPDRLKSPAFLAAEYAAVVLANRITEVQQYLRIARPGRGVRLSRKERVAIWQVVQAYRTLARADRTLDYAEAAALAAVHLDRIAAGGGGRSFEHIVVDEGQDLGPGHLMFLRALVATGPDDVFLAEDAHQRIYGQRLTLSKFGFAVRGRSSRLRLNYRTTAENLNLAQQVLVGADWVDADDQPEDSSGYRSVRHGPEPRIVHTATLVEEYDRAAELIGAWIRETQEQGRPLQTIGILVRDRRQRDLVVAALAERRVGVRAVDNQGIPDGQPVVLTMHRAKGTEFAKVLLMGVSKQNLPKVYGNLPAEELDDAVLRERALLYVAASRARDELVVSYAGEASPLMPENPPVG
ncbi:3'-5' exonuclease [Granulicoccus phenolivorans]|uniref:3'-5' exonuclease n=1 Tax=Granulicoccus phenolivorans TaxID=266854 RepID=UPI000411DB77|nr:3'-5' exonuclease [Granulicoccus phenolivorans]